MITAEMLRQRLERWGTRNDMRLYAQGYMERALGWVRPAAHFTQLRAGWDTADLDLQIAQRDGASTVSAAESAATASKPR